MRSPLTRERERVTTIFFYGVVLLLGYLFLRILTPFFAPLGWAVVLAIFVYPWHEKLVPRYGECARCRVEHAGRDRVDCRTGARRS